MMGVGKSTIGRKLADSLSFDFIDIDREIEVQEGTSISMIFKNKSENYFRMIESKITLRELKKSNVVIALGGGAFMNKTIRDLTKKTSTSFWLDINTNVLVQRLKKTKKRPLLFKKNLNDTINKIYMERKKTYSKADYRINCDLLKSEIIKLRILKLYEGAKA